MEIPTAVVAHLVSATNEVFETMVFKRLDTLAPIAGEAERPKSNVVATVAFAGHRRGLVAFHSSLPTARAIAGAMLGQSPETINGEMPDAIGEIANMIAGTFRTKLASTEPASAISVPTVTIGSDFSTRYLSQVRRALCPFKMEGEPVFVELILTGD
jgi:chemotaxis protein CheX